MKQFSILLQLLLLVSNCISAQSKITAITAKLFYNENTNGNVEDTVTGTFSPNIMQNSSFPLFNTIIGSGSAAGASNQTIVVVTIESKGKSNKDQQVKLTATAEKKIILQQQKTFSVLGDKTTYQLLFLLDDTGCEVIKLKAVLLEKGTTLSKLTKTIDFHCGE